MGLVKLILGFDKADIARLEERVNSLEKENARLSRALEELELALKTPYYTNGDNHGDIGSATQPTKDGEPPAGEDHNGSPREEELVISAIASGATSPREIIEATGLGKNKVYSILKKLVEAGVIERRRDGRRVRYVVAA